MFQLIVSVIAIALVAILAAASIYYGGSAFSSSTTKGNVAALINAGQQIAGANALYKVDMTVSAASMTDLANGVYLSAVPTAPRFATGAWTTDGSVAYISLAPNAKAQVCTEVSSQNGHVAAVDSASAPTLADLSGTNSAQFNCVGSYFAYRM